MDDKDKMKQLIYKLMLKIPNLFSSRIFLITLTLFSVGCASKTTSEPEPKNLEPIKVVKKPQKIEPVFIAPVKKDKSILLPEPPHHSTTVYFNYDSSELNDEAKSIIDLHVQFLKKFPEFSVTLEGHADIRGSDEYNQILGNLRVQAIKEILISEDVNINQINLISYGETKPVVIGDNENAWRSNRRAIFVYNEPQNQHVRKLFSQSEKMLVLDQ